MSYCYDVLHHAWVTLSESIPESEAKARFELLLDAMHNANHQANDVINKDKHVIRVAQELEEALGGKAWRVNR